jgi:two-component system, OmpR family, sensor kinase
LRSAHGAAGGRAYRRDDDRRARDPAPRSLDLAQALLTAWRALTDTRPTSATTGDNSDVRSATADRRSTHTHASIPSRLPHPAVRQLGLRARLTVALAIILTAAMGGAFIAVDRETGARVRSQIDHDLARDAAALARALSSRATSPTGVETAARGYLEDQPSFGSSARLYVIRVSGGSTITNQPELLGFATGTGIDHDAPEVQQRERAQAHAILSVGSGHHVLRLIDAGPVRLLVASVARRQHVIATVEIGEPWDAVARAEESVRHAFLLVGVLALLAAIIAAHLVARWIWRPVRVIADTAERIDAGELDHRIDAKGAPDEIRRLADGFDHMLDRLQHAFDREREFVADASHELRTPLTVIGGQIELLSLPGLSAEDTVRIVQLVHVEIARMNRLIEDMLLLATSDRGLTIQKRRFDLQPFLNDLFRGVQRSVDRRFEQSAQVTGTVDADEDRIAQVIRNLTRNAIEHTGPGGLVRLTAKAHGERVELAVEDDGPGIPEAERERIFDRFHRTDGSRSRSLGGSGLGLAIARAIVLAHGGHIWADQSPEGGARLALELPRFAGQLTLRPTLVARTRSERHSDRSGL